MAGDRDDMANHLASAEFFNPISDMWHAIGSINTERVYSPMTMVGQELIVSGGSSPGLFDQVWSLGTELDGTSWRCLTRAAVSIKFN